MYNKDAYAIQKRVTLMPRDRKKCAFMADIIVVQCIVVCIGSVSILTCVWVPDPSMYDYDKLARIMYLYDPDACGYKINVSKLIVNLHISNETFGLEVRPIKWLPAIVTVSTRLSAKTRRYIEMSFAIHIIWIILAIIFRIFAKTTTPIGTLKFVLSVFFYSCIIVICFDLSMAIVYVTHIKQSLTKGMILRYSGWSTELKLFKYDDFAGWLPMAASFCWLRGLVICILNIYFCRIISIIRRKIKRREFRKKYPNERYLPIPEPQQIEVNDDKTIVYRLGDKKPHAKDSNFFMF